MRPAFFAAILLIGLPAAAQETLIGKRLDLLGGVPGYVNAAHGVNNQNDRFDIEAWDHAADGTMHLVVYPTGGPANATITGHVALSAKDTAELQLSLDQCQVDGKDDKRVVGLGKAGPKETLDLVYAWQLTPQGGLLPILAPGKKPKNKVSCTNPLF